MPSFKIDFSEWKEEDVSLFPVFDDTPVVVLCVTLLNLSFSLKLNFDLDRGVFPMVIQAVVDEGDGGSQEQICSNTLESFSNRGELQLCCSVIFQTASDTLMCFWRPLKEYVFKNVNFSLRWKHL